MVPVPARRSDSPVEVLPRKKVDFFFALNIFGKPNLKYTGRLTNLIDLLILSETFWLPLSCAESLTPEQVSQDTNHIQSKSLSHKTEQNWIDQRAFDV